MTARNNASHDQCLLTMNDIDAVSIWILETSADPLARFPILQHVARDHCRVMALQLAVRGVCPDLANCVARHAYTLAALAAVSMHRAIWNAVLPDPDEGPRP